MKVDLFWHSYDYFPYEKQLAKTEIEHLFSNVEGYDDRGEYVTFSTSDNGTAPSKIERLTYFREGRSSEHNVNIPSQAKLEAAAHHGGLEVGLDGELRVPEISRQQTRYSAHGIHEYKGKFNPQVVRVLGNILGLEQGDWLLDPFSGSGTTLLEAKHIGWNAVGIEINPLAVAISNAKIQSVNLPISGIREARDEMISSLNATFSGLDSDSAFPDAEIQAIVTDGWTEDINGYGYLEEWFTESVLVQLWAIQDRINDLESSSMQLIFEVILSDILREVSLQDSGDLRTRRENNPPENHDVVSKFGEGITNHIDDLSRVEPYLPEKATHQEAFNLDTRSFSESLWKTLDEQDRPRKFDAAITSPPYATALPYVDTNRLSLIFFGMVDPGQIRDTERTLIGTRNIKKSSRDDFFDAIDNNSAELPEQCILLCRQLKAAVDPEEDGFRRQNKPALVYRYLRDMKDALRETRDVLKQGAPFAMIVGLNQTTLGGQQFTVDNPMLLEHIGDQVGYAVERNQELETHRRFGMHNSSHSIERENLLVLRK